MYYSIQSSLGLVLAKW
uniref:Uncharacterized protein n=1 Tax=Anopheles dirus TaxID=7168 RepID=A0A182NWE6_9DIPT